MRDEEADAPTGEDEATRLSKRGDSLRGQGRSAEALPFYRQVLAIREQTNGPHHPLVAASLWNLARLFQELGQDEQALPLYQRALQIWEQTNGPQQHVVAITLNILAQLYRGQGRTAEALPLAQRALQIWEQTRGPQHPWWPPA